LLYELFHLGNGVGDLVPLVVDDLVEFAEGVDLLFDDLAVKHC